MPRFDMGMSGEVPTAQDAKATQLMMAQGRYRMPIDSGYGDVYRPFATGFKDQRILTLETLYDFFINNVPDPDSAMAQDPNFDVKMTNHPDVTAFFRTRELTVAGMPARIEASQKAGVDGPTAEKVRAYVEDVIQDLPNPVEFYRQFQAAVLLGGQGFEFVWAVVNGYPRPVEYFPVHKTRFVFDRLGSLAVLTRTTPVWGAYVARTPQRMPSGEYAYHAPGGRFIYHKYMAEGGPWQRPADEGYLYWGRGENTRLYIPVMFDQFAIRFRMKWLEKHGLPLTILWHPDNWDAEAEKIVKSLRGEGIVKIPKVVGKEKDHFFDIDFKDPPTSGYDAFQQFQDDWVRDRIERIILGSADTTSQGSAGAYSAKQALREAGPKIIFRYDAKNIDDTINHQLIPYIVRARWPGMPSEYMPKHVMEPKEHKDELTRMQIAAAASQLVPLKTDEIYEAAGFERPKEGDTDVVFNPGTSDNPFEGMGGLGGGSMFPGEPGGAGNQPTAIGQSDANEMEALTKRERLQ